ncbi:HAD hydrolase-like protein [Dermatobacter hominis]|uniref:HAD hydrolase-like protein n=1 Tax=Dermatobacter hominis TaxID=2884263 RepID=UPI001D12F454|nr:HAD hydrolase-like protein [Dermatobacter hominis]UDY34069.1 HAD hydrolase-like protein [Dermatobacter hominis]
MHVIFDLDGTVWDSEPGILACMAHALHELGREVPTDDVLRSHIGPPLRSMLAEVGVPEPQLDDGVRLYRERYLTEGVYEASLYDGVVALLDAVAHDGHTLATATSKGEDPTLTMLEHFGIRDRFEVVGAATMDGAATTKSEVLARTLDGLGDPARSTCVLVGDRDLDVRGAAAHGVDCIGAAWGYGGAEELRAAGAWAIADSPADVPGLLDHR